MFRYPVLERVQILIFFTYKFIRLDYFIPAVYEIKDYLSHDNLDL